MIISMMMQSTNQKCNAVESVFGIFLHASNTPSKVIETLTHIKISISEQSIERAVKSLSVESYSKLREMGQSLLVSYAYDNFDIDFGVIVPTVEKETDTLTHMTSGDVIAWSQSRAPEMLRGTLAKITIESQHQSYHTTSTAYRSRSRTAPSRGRPSIKSHPS